MERELITKDDSRRINSMNILSSSSNKDTRQQEIVTSDIYEFQDNPDPGVYLPPHRSHHLKTAQTESVHVNRFSPSEGARSSSFSIQIGPPPIKRLRASSYLMEGQRICASTTDSDSKRAPPLKMKIFLSRGSNDQSMKPRITQPQSSADNSNVNCCDPSSSKQLLTRSRTRTRILSHQPIRLSELVEERVNDSPCNLQAAESSEPLFEEKSDNSRSSYSDDGSQSRSECTQPNELVKVIQKDSYSSNVLNSLFAMNSYEQALNFRNMVESSWVKLYKERQSKLLESVKSTTIPLQRLFKDEPELQIELSDQQTASWPLSLKKLGLELANERCLLSEEQRIERKKFLELIEREYFRIIGGDDFRLFSLVKVLKDAGLYNYDIFADEMTNQSSDQKMDKAMQITQLRNRFKHVSMMMKNRQTMEADSLFVCQKARWEKAWGTFQKQNYVAGGELSHEHILAKIAFLNAPIVTSDTTTLFTIPFR